MAATLTTALRTPTVEQSAAVINSARAACDEAAFNRLLVLIERQWGSEHMRTAHALAHDLHMQASGAVKDAEGHWTRPAPAPRYVKRGGDVADTDSGRFYCTMAAWPYSPAARAGAVLG